MPDLNHLIDNLFQEDSTQGIQFRRWATRILSPFALRGYFLDKNRLTDSPGRDDHWAYLLEMLEEISLSRRSSAQCLGDLFATAEDYDQCSPLTRAFYARLITLQGTPEGRQHLDQLLHRALKFAQTMAEARIPVSSLQIISLDPTT